MLSNAHWIALAALGAFALSLFLGVLPSSYALSALVTGVIFFLSIVAVWHSRTKLAFAVLFLVLISGHKVAEHFGNPILGAYSQYFRLFFQWITLLLMVSFALLALFRTRIARYCRLDENQ